MPLYTINCVQAFCSDCIVSDVIVNSCIILSHLNSAGNPLLYAYRLSDFRSAFRGLLFGVFSSSSEHVIIAGRSDFERSSPKARPIISISFHPRKFKLCKDSKKLFRLEKEAANYDVRLSRLKQTVDDCSINSNSNEKFMNRLNKDGGSNFAYLNSVYMDVEKLQKIKLPMNGTNRKRIRSAVDDRPLSYVLMINEDNPSLEDSTTTGVANTDLLKPDPRSNKKTLKRRHSTDI